MHDKRLMSHKVNARFEVLVHSKTLLFHRVPTPFQVHNKRPLFHKVHTPFEVHSKNWATVPQSTHTRALSRVVGRAAGRCPVLWAGPQGAVPSCGDFREA